MAEHALDRPVPAEGMPSARPGTMSGALARLCAAVEPGGRVVRVRRLHGGLANLVHAVDVRTASGERRRWVVRRRPRASPAQASGPYSRLWQTLGLLEDTAISAPRRVWHDPAGGLFGAPTVVVTRLPGRSLLAPRNLAGWTRQLAEALARIHDPALGRRGLEFLPDLMAQTAQSLAEPAERLEPGRLRHPAGRALWEALRAGWPRVRPGPPVLVHRDYHPSNTVWLRGRLSGVVDWDDASRGAPEYDLAMCRVELALLFGPGEATDFLRAYEVATHGPADVAFWDLYRAWLTLPDPERWLPGLHRLGRTDLTAALLRERLDAFIGDALARAT